MLKFTIPRIITAGRMRKLQGFKLMTQHPATSWWSPPSLATLEESWSSHPVAVSCMREQAPLTGMHGHMGA